MGGTTSAYDFCLKVHDWRVPVKILGARCPAYFLKFLHRASPCPRASLTGHMPGVNTTSDPGITVDESEVNNQRHVLF